MGIHYKALIMAVVVGLYAYVADKMESKNLILNFIILFVLISIVGSLIDKYRNQYKEKSNH